MTSRAESDVRCECGGSVRYTSTNECSACYKRRIRKERPGYAAQEREISRRWKDRNRDRNRARDRAYSKRGRVPCACGDTKPADAERCGKCEMRLLAAQKRKQVEQMWHDGLLLREIAERMGWGMGHLQSEMGRMRRAGYDLPRRPPGGIRTEARAA